MRSGEVLTFLRNMLPLRSEEMEFLQNASTYLPHCMASNSIRH